MRIEKAIESMYRSGWVRFEEFRRLSGRCFVLLFSIHKGQNGRQLDVWRIECSQVREARISEWDLGGVAVYPSRHPAARQFIARQAEIRWNGASNDPLIAGALYKAHTEAVNDWIDFDTYSRIREISNSKCSCQGPEFLMRAYAKALRSLGREPQIMMRGRGPKTRQLKVLHFGASRVVAEGFIAERIVPSKT